MPISNNSFSNNSIVPIKNQDGFRFKESELKFSFETSDHILTDGLKAKHRVAFTSEVDRDNFYDSIQNDPYLIFDFSISKSENVATGGGEPTETSQRNVSARGTEYYVIIEANVIGSDFNTITLPSGGTYSQITTGSSNVYQDNYQLVIFGVDDENNLLFKRAYPYYDDGTPVATWNIDFIDGLEPYVSNSDKPISDILSPINKIETPIKWVKLIYAEGWQDQSVNNGLFTLYNFQTSLELIVSNARLRTGEVLGYIPNDSQFANIYETKNNFLFLNSFDRNYDYKIGSTSNDFLYFYIPREMDGIITSIKTTTVLN